MSKTAPLYLRLPADLKEQVDTEAAVSDASLTAVVARLVDAGLRNSDTTVASLRARVDQLEADVASLTSQRDAALAELAALREDIGKNQQLLQSMVAQLQLPVGKCPTCNEMVSGEDVVVRGACRSGHNLRPSVVSSSSKSSFNPSDLLVALTVAGLALGAAVVVSRNA